MLPGIASSDSWFGYVKTTDDFWSVYRHGNNMSFESDQYIEGMIKPFEGPRGRVLSPYCSHFENMNLNDINLNERTGAMEGNYSSSEQVAAWAHVNPPIGLDINKPADSDIYIIEFIEKWPADISASRSLKYSGMGINNQDLSGSNLDFVETNLLYNKKLSKDLFVKMRLEKMNATVIATNDTIISAEKKATRDLDFRISTSTTGIADFKYQQSGSEFNSAPLTSHEILNRGDDRYYGSFNITKNIRISSRFDNSKEKDYWLPCCYQGLKDMNIFDKRSISMDRIFNCTCSGI
jgi:hypothetical protein